MSDHQPVGTSPWALGLLAALLYLLAALLVIQLGGCMLEPPVNLGPVQTSWPGQRSVSEQTAAAVQVLSLCMTESENEMELTMSMGSGVMIDSSHVLTAAHVVACPEGRASVTVRTAWGTSAWTVVVKEDKASDLAKLVTMVDGALASEGHKVSRARVSQRPIPGDTVCAAVAMPHRDRRCGRVKELDHLPRLEHDELEHSLWNSDVWYGGQVRHGNSGSGVYDAAGNLVGILTELDPFHETGGRFTSLEAHEDLTRS